MARLLLYEHLRWDGQAVQRRHGAPTSQKGEGGHGEAFRASSCRRDDREHYWDDEEQRYRSLRFVGRGG